MPDHPTGGLTALMFAVRNGHEDIARALVKGGADLKATNGDNATATIIAIVNDRFDLAKTLIDLGADPTTGRCTSPSICTTPRVTCARATGRGCERSTRTR
jgi:hypothetical protein